MAIYHLSAKPISRATGRSSTGAAAYRAGEKIVDVRTGIVHDYARKRGIDHSEIMAPANAPDWVHDRAKLWNAVEHSEKRKDSQLARDVEVALPTELNADQQRELVRGFVRSQFVAAGMVADIAIHHSKGENPHAHILLTMRDIGPDGFGQKNRSWNDRSLLEKWREQWAEHTNRALERAGHSARIDHRTLEAQGIERIPQIHIGPHVPEMERRGIRTERGTAALAIETKNEAIAALQSDLEAARNERNHETPAGPEPGADRGRTRTAGRVAGDPGRSGPGQHQRTGGAELAASEGMEQQAGERGGGGQQSSDQRERSNSSPLSDSRGAEGGTATSVQEYGYRGDHVSHPRSTAFADIVALAGTGTRSEEHTGRERRSGVSQARDSGRAETQMKPDRTYLAARRQLDAMGVDSFEVGVRDKAGRMLTRTWSKDEVLKSIPWLKRQNALGADVYIRPAGEHSQGIVLVDDLTRQQLDRMKAAGYAPAAVVETSPTNFQAWVRVSPEPLSPIVGTASARLLAQAFEGDMNSADWRHYGRLAGFTNRKPEHIDDRGRSPYVLAHESPGKLAEMAPELLKTAQELVFQAEAALESKKRLEALEGFKPLGHGWMSDPVHEYKRQAQQLLERYGSRTDYSKLDWMIATDMSKSGRFDQKAIERAIFEHSPEVSTRKAGHVHDYARRTAEKAWNAPEVQAHREQEAEKSNTRGRGYSR